MLITFADSYHVFKAPTVRLGYLSQFIPLSSPRPPPRFPGEKRPEASCQRSHSAIRIELASGPPRAPHPAPDIQDLLYLTSAPTPPPEIITPHHLTNIFLEVRLCIHFLAALLSSCVTLNNFLNLSVSVSFSVEWCLELYLSLRGQMRQ